LPPKTCSSTRSTFTSLQRAYRMATSLVFVGNGMSAVACVEELLKNGRDFDITIFGDEPYTNYARALLPSVLAGERDIDSIVLNDIEWYQEHGIRTRLGIRVEEIDRLGCAVRSSDGDWTSYDKLILATGSSAVIPPVEGLDKDGVFFFSTLDDTRKIIDAASEGARAVVTGDWLAAEAGRGLRKRGCDVTVAEIEAVLGDERVEAVRFTNGEVAAADLVVIAMGFRSNVQLALEAGLKVDRGILVNDHLETSDPHIFALGGCADCPPPLLEQAKVLAANLSGHRLSTTALSRR
jgi:nitrite reductase (NADH) large subunit